MRELVKRPAARFRACVAVLLTLGLALAGSVPAAIAEDAAAVNTAAAEPSAAAGDDDAKAEAPSAENPAGGGTSDLDTPDSDGEVSPDAVADAEAEADPESAPEAQEADPESDPNADELDLLGLSMFAALPRANSSNGVEALSSMGEMYLFNPATNSISPLPPYLPGIYNNGAFAPGSKRELRYGITSLQCKQSRPIRKDKQWCYFAKGVNYNALGVGEDGTRYVTLKIGQAGTPYDGKPGASKRPIFQVYRLAPDATEWSKFGPEFEFPYAPVPGGALLNDLTFNGGQVAPDGTYYLAMTDKEGTGKNAKLVSHIYKMTASGLEKVGDVYDSTYSSDVTGNDGDIVFTKSGDLLVGFTHHRADIPGSKNPGYNEVSFEVVTRGTLDSARGGTLSSYHLVTAKMRNGEVKGEQNSDLGPVTGISIGPDGTLITSHFTKGDSVSTYVRYPSADGGAPQKLGSMPNTVYQNWGTSPDPNSGWADPFAKWMQEYNNSGKPYQQAVLWTGEITDLAGEAVIPSVTVKKVVEGRADAKDQFTVSVKATDVTKSATTEKQQTEVSTDRLPVFANTIVTLTETINRRHATLDTYDVSLQCDGGLTPSKPTISGNQATASVTVKGRVGDVVCTFTNTPKSSGKMEWAKEDERGNLLGGSSWTLAREDGDAFKIDGALKAANSFSINDATSAGGHDRDPASGQFLVTGLKPGKYTLREADAPAGYKKSDKTYTFTINSPADAVNKVHLFDGRQATVGAFGRHNAVPNYPVKGSLAFDKRAKQVGNPTGNEPLLSGSAWTLKRADGKPFTIGANSRAQTSWRITDCVGVVDAACQGISQDTDSRAGQFRVTGLPLGDYELVESKAPTGYVLDTTPKTFTIDADNLDVKFEGAHSIYNTQQAGPTIPLTGGIGRDFYVFLGAGVLGIALLIRLALLRKRH